MKHFLSVLSLIVLTGSLFAQTPIILDSSDIYTPGTDFDVVRGGNPGIVNVSGTVNHTWDLSGVTADSTFEVNIRALNTTSFPQDTAYPGSNVVTENPVDGTIYFKKDKDSLNIDGVLQLPFVAGVNMDMNFDPDIKLIDFPFTYLDGNTGVTHIDTIIDTVIAIYSKIRIEGDLGFITNVDGWGVLTTPQQSFDVLKVFTKEYRDLDVNGFNTLTSQWTTVPIIEINDTTFRYRWYAEDESYQVAEAVADAPNGTVTEVYYKLTDSLFSYISEFKDPGCFGQSTGEATVAVIGGSGNFTYQWGASAGSQGTAKATNLPSGSHSVTVTDIVSNKTATTTATLTDPPALSLSVDSIIHEDTVANTGEIWVSPSGGTPPYRYAWDNSSSTTSIGDDLPGGDNTVTITDDNGCQVDTTITLSSSLGIGDLTKGTDHWKLLPQPAQDWISIQGIEGEFTLELFNVLGESEMKLIGQPEEKIDLRSIESGLHIILISRNGDELIQRLVIQ